MGDFERRAVRLIEGEGVPARSWSWPAAAARCGRYSTWAVGRPGSPGRGEAVVLLRSEAAEYGGERREGGTADELAPFEFVVLGPPGYRAFP